MSTGRTEDLIVALAADAGPVERLPPVHVRVSRWIAAAGLATAAGVVAIGVRADLRAVLLESGFVVDAVLASATALLAIVSAFTLSVPGAERLRWQRVLPGATALAWVGLLGLRFSTAGGTWRALAAEPWHVACGLQILSLSVIPAVVAFGMIRRAAPLEPRWTAALASLGALAIAALGVQVTCPIGSASHLLVAHAVPVIALTVLGMAAGAPRLRRRWTSSAATELGGR